MLPEHRFEHLDHEALLALGWRLVSKSVGDEN
jgi:hypothetical protein